MIERRSGDVEDVANSGGCGEGEGVVEEGKVTSNFFVILMMVVNISTWMVIALTC